MFQRVLQAFYVSYPTISKKHISETLKEGGMQALYVLLNGTNHIDYLLHLSRLNNHKNFAKISAVDLAGMPHGIRRYIWWEIGNQINNVGISNLFLITKHGYLPTSTCSTCSQQNSSLSTRFPRHKFKLLDRILLKVISFLQDCLAFRRKVFKGQKRKKHRHGFSIFARRVSYILSGFRQDRKMLQLRQRVVEEFFFQNGKR